MRNRPGFTLVELLIVIVVIGILAGGMMLASGSATESAQASSVVSGLRGAKGAALDWFTNHAGLPDPGIDAWKENESLFPEIVAALDNKEMANKLKLTAFDDGRIYYFVGLQASSSSVAKKAFTQLGANGVAYIPRSDGDALVSSDNASFPDGATLVFMLVK